MSSVYFQPGVIIAGQCRIIRPIGIGKMGVVYLCQHLDLPDTFLALKVLTVSGSKKGGPCDDRYLTRFQNEITATYRVNNEHVVRTYGYITEEDWVGYTMEFIDGGDLSQLIQAHAPLPIANIVKLLIQACDGVQAIHDADIIHRDLKPANILLDRKGNIKITDFGIARMPDLPKLTATGNLLGTFEYLSPQYLQDGVGTTLGDIYALGVIAFEMITGAVPFDKVGLFNMITAKVTQDPPLVDTINPRCPSALAEIVAIALQRDIKTRYQSAKEMKGDLELVYESYQYEDEIEDISKDYLEIQVSPQVPPTPKESIVSDSGISSSNKIKSVPIHEIITESEPPPQEDKASLASEVSEPVAKVGFEKTKPLESKLENNYNIDEDTVFPNTKQLLKILLKKNREQTQQT